MTIELGILVPHPPRMCFEEQAPAFQTELIEGLHEVAGVIGGNKPDAIVIVSCHWASTFNHYVDITPEHKGILTPSESPDMITNLPYHYPGDIELGKEIVEEGRLVGIPVKEVNDSTYIWDYGTVVPVRYLVPNSDIPIINLSVTLVADLEETYKWGQRIGKVLRESDKRIMFVSSGALSHNLVRGPEKMPTLAEQALDRQFLDYLKNNDLQSAWNMLPQYAKNAKVESGGRHLAMLLGVLEGECKSKFYGYGQSSGSGNVVMTFEPQYSIDTQLNSAI